MLTIENLLNSRDHVNETADMMQPEDIDYLIELLNINNNDIRYAALLVLESRSSRYTDVYDYWDIFVEKLSNENSYQRSIGIMMIASNIKWDKPNKFEIIAEHYLSLCEDEKFITARQTIQSIEKWINIKPNIQPMIVHALLSIDILNKKETQKKLFLMDILRILAKINENSSLMEEICLYVKNSLESGILDIKSTKEIKLLFRHHIKEITI